MVDYSWWRHQMETFSAWLAICAGNSPVPGEVPAQRPVTRSFDIFFDLRLNKRSSKQSWGWWFETLSTPVWRHCNVRCVSYRKQCDNSLSQYDDDVTFVSFHKLGSFALDLRSKWINVHIWEACTNPKLSSVCKHELFDQFSFAICCNMETANVLKQQI